MCPSYWAPWERMYSDNSPGAATSVSGATGGAAGAAAITDCGDRPPTCAW